MTVKLIQGDCLEEMLKLANDGVKVDLVLTDPPYGTTSCKWDNIIPFKEMWDCLDKLTYENTPIVLFGSEPFSSNLRMSNIKNYKYDWIWKKNQCSGFMFAKKQPLRNYENVMVFYDKQCTYNPIKEKRDEKPSSISRRKYMMSGCEWSGGIYGDFISIKEKKFVSDLCYPKQIKSFETVHTSKRLHSSQKPVELLEYLIKTYTNEDDLVLDFTMGSGSTGVACVNTNRNFIGIELDENYYKIAQERINETKKQTKLM